MGRYRIDECANCGKQAEINGYGLCGTCYGYWYRTGHQRPPELIEAADAQPDPDPWWMDCSVERFEQYLAELGK